MQIFGRINLIKMYNSPCSSYCHVLNGYTFLLYKRSLKMFMHRNYNQFFIGCRVLNKNKYIPWNKRRWKTITFDFYFIQEPSSYV